MTTTGGSTSTHHHQQPPPPLQPISTGVASSAVASTTNDGDPLSVNAVVTGGGTTTCNVIGPCTSAQNRKGHRRQESVYEMTGLYSEVIADDSGSELPTSVTNLQASPIPDTVIKCHSRQPSSGIVDR